MSSNDEDDFAPPEGYTVPVEKPLPSTEGDESLARYQASLGIRPGAIGGEGTGPKVTVLRLELVSPSLPPEKKLVLELDQLAPSKEITFVIKKGIVYNVRITFKVNHSIVSGLRYIQVVRLRGLGLKDKMQEMVGSYAYSEKPYTKDFRTEESLSSFMTPSGPYNVRSQILDDDKNVYADWEWKFKLEKDW